MSTGAESAKAQGQAVAQEQESSLLDQIVANGRMASVDDPRQQEYAKKLVGTLVDLVVEDHMKVSGDLVATIKSHIAEIDRLLTKQLNAVMHTPEFQKLEASWRGLHYFVMQSETSEMLKIRVLNATKDELSKDMKKAAEFDQSALFKKVYEEGFGTYGGEPFAALVGDYEFTRHPQDIELLTKISNVSASAHAPFLTAASPKLFNWEAFEDMTNVRALEKIFGTEEYVKWKSFRESEDSRYVGLCLPHILLREPYGRDSRPVEAFNFEEEVDGKDNSKYLWGNAAFAMATRLTESFAKHRWCATIRGVQNGGLVAGLPTHTFKTDEGDIALKCPTEVAITDRREKELSDLGFIPLVHCKGTDYAAFFAAQSAQKAKKYDNDSANANARLSAQLPYIFSTSRFAHYLKAMMRDYVGSFMSREDCERMLNRWITGYVTSDPAASADVKAEFPLQEARVDVMEVPGKPGCYRAIAFLKPHFQLDELTVSLRLVADLPQRAGG